MTAHYTTLYTIDPATGWYRPRVISGLEQFLQEYQLDNTDSLLALCWNTQAEIRVRAQALSCLRCLISQFIVQACLSLARKYGQNGHDLLPYVLDDDHSNLLFFDTEGNPVQIKGEKPPYKYFAIQVVHSYAWQDTGRESLKNWTYRLVRQHKEIQKALGTGYSDFTLLKIVSKRQLSALTEGERNLVLLFREVYRSYHLTQPELVNSLELTARQLISSRPDYELIRLIAQLKAIANRLRPPQIELPGDLPEQLSHETSGESFLFEEITPQVESILREHIRRAIGQQLNKTRNKSRYKKFIGQVISGLCLYYCQGLSYQAIASQLGFSSKDQAGRVLECDIILNLVRSEATPEIKMLLVKIAEENGKSYNENAAETYIDQVIFIPAAQDSKSPVSPRTMQSWYSRLFCEILDQFGGN